MGKRSTGEPTPYVDTDEAAAEAAIDEAWANYEGDDGGGEPDLSDMLVDQAERAAWPGPGGGGGGDGAPAGTGRVERSRPSRLHVRANVEWAGSYNSNPHRWLRAENIDVASLGPALRRAREAKRDASQARSYRSYRAVGWHAQVNQLVSTRAGREAADKVGIDVTPRTVQAWLAQERDPSKANREKIAEAYGRARDREIIAARDRVKEANHEVAQKLSNILSDQYGAEIRLFDISQMEIKK